MCLNVFLFLKVAPVKHSVLRNAGKRKMIRKQKSAAKKIERQNSDVIIYYIFNNYQMTLPANPPFFSFSTRENQYIENK